MSVVEKSSLESIRIFVFSFCLFALVAFALKPMAGHLLEVTDFPEYYCAAKFAVSGNAAAAYVPADLELAEHNSFPGMGDRFLVFPYPPMALLGLYPLGLLPPRPSLVVWTIFLIGCLSLSVIVVRRMFELTTRQTLWLSALIACSGPAWEAIRMAKVTPLLLVCLTTMLFALRKNRIGLAATAAAVALMKPDLMLPFLAFAGGSGRVRFVAQAAAVVAALNLLALVILGTPAFANFLTLVPEISRHPSWMVPSVQPTLSAQLEIANVLDAVKAVTFGRSIYVVTLAVSFIFGLVSRGNERWLERALLVVLPLTLMTALHCHNYEMLLLAPTLIFTFKTIWDTRMFEGRRAKLSLCVLVSSVILLMPLYNFIHYGLNLRGAQFNLLFWWLLALTLCGALNVDRTIEKPAASA